MEQTLNTLGATQPKAPPPPKAPLPQANPAATTDAERFRVGPDSWVLVQFQGPVNQRAIKKLIRHYEENLDLYPADGDEREARSPQGGEDAE